MSRYKRIGIFVAVVGLLIAGVALGYRHYAQTYSFAPESPEQQHLAIAHAQCVGLYFVLDSAEEGRKEKDLNMQKKYKVDMEYHAKLGLNFSPDKELFQKQVEEAAQKVVADILAFNDAPKAARFVSESVDRCIDAMFESHKFIETKLNERKRL